MEHEDLTNVGFKLQVTIKQGARMIHGMKVHISRCTIYFHDHGHAQKMLLWFSIPILEHQMLDKI
jgi:hypothetical protein